jgi:hypothetical protein
VIKDTSVGDLDHTKRGRGEVTQSPKQPCPKMLLRVQKIAEYLLSATSNFGEVMPITAGAPQTLLFLEQHRGFPLF